MQLQFPRYMTISLLSSFRRYGGIGFKFIERANPRYRRVFSGKRAAGCLIPESLFTLNARNVSRLRNLRRNYVQLCLALGRQ